MNRERIETIICNAILINRATGIGLDKIKKYVDFYEKLGLEDNELKDILDALCQKKVICNKAGLYYPSKGGI